MKHIIPARFILIAVLILRLIFSGNAFGSHTMGADLTYQCMGGNTYKITLSFYRDCIGIPAPANPLVTINSASCNKSLSVTCYPRVGTGKEVTPSCSSSVTTCNGGSFTGIQEWIYDGIVTLPSQCTDWVFGYTLCCRNAAITTINNPSSNTFYIYATLNNVAAQCNSSPTFSNKPVPFLCIGQQFCFNHGAYDADGDSLAYSLITPKQTASSTVGYRNPYNAANPLNSSPATSFNSSSGDICLTPQQLEVTVMAVLVSEYRNGVLIGTVERDLQLTVMNCNNNLPWLTGINGTNSFTMTMCANQQNCFNIFSNDPDAGQTLVVDWNYGIPGANFTSGPGAHPTGTFCWTPDDANIGHTYTFTATVHDDACPYYGSQTYSYTIDVIGMQVNAGPDQAIACSDLATLTATASGGSGTYTYSWSNGSTMRSITVGAGTYIVTASDGTCTATDTVVVTMPFIPVAAFTYTTPGCTNSPVTFTDQSTTPSGTINLWNWDFGDGGTSLLQNPSHIFPGMGTYNVTLIVGNTLGCLDTIVHPVTIGAPPVADFGWTAACVNTPIVFDDQSTGAASSWNWSFGDGTFSTQQNPSHTFPTTGTFTVTLIAGSTTACPDTISHTITVNPEPVITASADQTICSGSQVTLSVTGGQTCSWMPGGQMNSSITITPTSSSIFIVNATDSNGCSSSDTVNVFLLPLPTLNAGSDQAICGGGSVTLTASGSVTYSWMPSGSTAASISVNPASTTTYTVTGTGANGCTANDAVIVSVNSPSVASAGSDKNICNGSGATLTASGGGTYVWSPGGATSQTINVNPASNQVYVVTVTDVNGCSSSDSAQVNVSVSPVVNLQSFFLCAGSTATLDAGNPGSTYSWSTGATTRVISITTGGLYSVVVTNPFGCSASASCNVNYGSSIAINLGNVSFCQGDSATFDAGYSGMSYVWSPGGQTTQTITVKTGGTYGVVVSDTSGCSGSINVTATVNPLPVADFTSLSACFGNPVYFTDVTTVSPGSITAWLWDLGDGSTSTIRNPSHNYSTTGNYTVTLRSTSNAGCSSIVSHTTSVNPLPVADFSYANNCKGNAVLFNDLSSVSSGNIVTYNWTFGDGGSSTSQNPVHTYTTSGNFNVRLQVTTAGGCSKVKNKSITIHPKPVAAFISTPVCIGNTTTFNNSSSIVTGAISGYSWDFNDTYTSTQTSPTHTFSTAGNFAVRLITTSTLGCSDTLIQNVTVNALPVANAGADQAKCGGTTATLNASGGNTYIWNPGGQTTSEISVSPSSTTIYTVTVTNANGCSSTDAVLVQVNPLPVAVAGVNQAICKGSSIMLNGSGGLNYSWLPGGMTSASINVQPSATTIYQLTVTDANGCSDIDSVTVTVNTVPVVSAGPDNTICKGSTTSLDATGASTYLWNPIGLTTASVLVTPNSTTTYTVTGTSVNGCSSSDAITVIVNSVPVLNFIPTFVCDGSSTTLDAGNPGSTYTWSTGENSQTISVNDSGTYTVIVTSPNGCPAFASTYVTKVGTFNLAPVSYAVCGGQTATLDAGNAGSTYQWSTGQTTRTINASNAGNYFVTVTDVNGCAATLQHILAVNPLPVPQFSPSNVCFGTPASLMDQSAISAGTIQSILWNFGDSNSSASANNLHNYSSTGNYSVSLTATSAAGCTASIIKQIQVNPNPVANFSTVPTCTNTPVSFSDQSIIATGSITGWNWNFGDGNTSVSSTTTHLYGSAGNYTANLTITSSAGCSNTISKTITTLDIPVAAFSTTDQCAQNNVSIINSTSSAGSPITSYQWTFGNGATSSAFQPNIQFASSGSFNVNLVATNSNGCSDTATSPITIYPLPAANFTSAASCSGTPVTFQNNSAITGGLIQNYYWLFGDNSSSALRQPSHAYSGNGNYSVSLIAISSFGCRDTITQPLSINPTPLASFTAPNVCNGNDISFQNSSTINSGNIASYTWNFNDGSNSTQAAPLHRYSSTGTFSVTLTITSDNGCVSTATSAVNVFPNPVAAFTTSNVCLGNSSQFLNQSWVDGGGSLNSSWMYSDGDSSTDESPIHEFTTPTNQTVTLLITTSNGCTNLTSQPVDVYNPPVAMFAAPNDCSGRPISFTNHSTSQDGNITSFLWGFGDGSYSFDANPTHAFSDSGNYNVDLVAVSSLGCMGKHSDSVSVFSNPVPSMQLNDACVGSPIQFSASNNSGGLASYQWNVGNIYSSTSSGFNYVFTNPGTYSVSLNVTSTNGCNGSHTESVTVYPHPEAVFSANDACQSAQTVFTNGSTITSGSIAGYSWNLGDGNQSTQLNPVHTFSNPGTYNAMLTVVSDRGCSVSFAKAVNVHPVPVATFAAGMQGCAPVTSSFTSTSTVTNGNIAGYLWNFGDGDISTDQYPQHVYGNTGRYDVTLTVVTDYGCQASHTAQNAIYVFPQPNADFNADPMVTDIQMPVVHFQNQSHNYLGYQWTFGDGTSTQTDLNPTHTFADTGTYSAMLITVNEFGCRDSIMKTIEVKLHSTLYIANCFTPNGDGNNDDFRPYYTNMESIQVWIFDRWGKLLTSWDDLNGAWNGYYQGRKCQSDTYVYKIRGRGLDGKYSEWIGHVSIVY